MLSILFSTMVIYNRCIGWDCLTHAQQIGVIVSIVAGFIFLAIGFSCVLGYLAISEAQKTQHRNRQALRASLQTQPMHPLSQFGGAAIVPVQYPPAVYNSFATGQYIPQNPPLQHIIRPQPAYMLPSGVRYARTPSHQTYLYAVPQQDPTHLPKQQAEQRHARKRFEGPASESLPSWFKRMMQNERPAGRASTIRSGPSSEYLSSELSDCLHQAERSDTHVKQSTTPIPNRLATAIPEMPSAASANGVLAEQPAPMEAIAETSNNSSINTTAATVHSDDFNSKEG